MILVHARLPVFNGNTQLKETIQCERKGQTNNRMNALFDCDLINVFNKTRMRPTEFHYSMWHTGEHTDFICNTKLGICI